MHYKHVSKSKKKGKNKVLAFMTVLEYVHVGLI